MHSRVRQTAMFAVLTLLPFLGPPVAEEYPPDESIMKGQYLSVPTEFEAPVALVYLDEIDARIGEIVDRYPQLAARGVAKGKASSGSGKTRTRDRLDYVHNLVSLRESTQRIVWARYRNGPARANRARSNPRRDRRPGHPHASPSPRIEVS